MTPADPKTSTTAPAVQAGQGRPRDGYDRALSTHTTTARMKAAVACFQEAPAHEIAAKLDELYGDPDHESDEGLEEIGDKEPMPGVWPCSRSQLRWGESETLDWAQENNVGFGNPTKTTSPSSALEPDGRFRPSRRDLDQTDWARGPDVAEREEDPDYEPQGVMIPLGKTMIDLEDYEKSDYEPSMGAAEGETGSVAWSQGGSVFEEEPSLGSVGHIDQRHWANHTDPTLWLCLDVEEACEDEGAQCEDEGHDSDREPDTDCEGDAQAPCHASTDACSGHGRP